MIDRSTIDQDPAPSETLAALVTRLSNAVRAEPGHLASRLALGEALILQGAFERAELQLSTLSQMDGTMPVRIARLRHLLRAEIARHAWYERGAAPDLLGAPAAAQRAALAMAVAARDDGAAAGKLGEDTEAARDKRPGVADGVPFDDLRDLDDLCACYLEVLTADGGYLWVDWPAVSAIVFTPPNRLIDLLWREARLTLWDGRAADVVIPAQYVSPAAEDAHRLAQRTDWRSQAGLVRGTGQRCFLLGEDDFGILSLTDLRFERLA